MLATLAELHIGALPVALEKNIRKWGGFFGEGLLQTVALLELSSFEVLANLANDEEIGPLISAIEGASKPLAVVAAANAEVVRRVLEERGVVFKRNGVPQFPKSGIGESKVTIELVNKLRDDEVA